MSVERDLVCYLLVRTDLPSMNSGKAMSQCHHAGVQMMGQYRNHWLLQEYISAGLAQGAAWFNTTLVLAASQEDISNIVIDLCKVTDVLAGNVVDLSYPFIVESEEIARLIPQTATTKFVKKLDNGKVLMTREEMTCAWFLGSRTDPRFIGLFERLHLHP